MRKMLRLWNNVDIIRKFHYFWVCNYKAATYTESSHAMEFERPTGSQWNTCVKPRSEAKFKELEAINLGKCQPNSKTRSETMRFISLQLRLVHLSRLFPRTSRPSTVALHTFAGGPALKWPRGRPGTSCEVGMCWLNRWEYVRVVVVVWVLCCCCCCCWCWCIDVGGCCCTCDCREDEDETCLLLALSLHLQNIIQCIKTPTNEMKQHLAAKYIYYTSWHWKFILQNGHRSF